MYGLWSFESQFLIFIDLLTLTGMKTLFLNGLRLSQLMNTEPSKASGL